MFTQTFPPVPKSVSETLPLFTEKLAREFSRLLHRDLSAAETIQSVLAGKTSPDDHIDSNMTMDEAFINVMHRRFVFLNDEKPELTTTQNAFDTDLMNDAWALAEKNRYYEGQPLQYIGPKANITVVSASNDENDKIFSELGEAVHYAENTSMKSDDPLAVKVNDIIFGFAERGCWEDDQPLLLEPSTI